MCAAFAARKFAQRTHPNAVRCVHSIGTVVPIEASVDVFAAENLDHLAPQVGMDLEPCLGRQFIDILSINAFQFCTQRNIPKYKYFGALSSAIDRFSAQFSAIQEHFGYKENP